MKYDYYNENNEYIPKVIDRQNEKGTVKILEKCSRSSKQMSNLIASNLKQ